MTLYQAWLTTLDHVKQHRDLTSAQTDDDDFLKSLIQEASMEFIEAIGRFPLPHVATYNFNARGEHIKAYTLDIEQEDAKDLLAVTTLTNGDATTISAGNIVLMPANGYPKWRIQIKESAGVVFTYDTDWEQAISVAGVWGYLPHWGANAITDSGQDGTLADTTSATLAVTDGTAYEVGQYLRIESEYLFVSTISGNNLTVERGALGSTAAAHAAKDIEVVNVMHDVRSAVREIVVYRFKGRDQIGGQVQIIGPEGRVIVQDLDPQVGRTIERHRYNRAKVRVV